jgi:hypothetical protein
VSACERRALRPSRAHDARRACRALVTAQANNEPTGRDELLGYVDEMLAPPTPAPAPALVEASET